MTEITYTCRFVDYGREVAVVSDCHQTAAERACERGFSEWLFECHPPYTVEVTDPQGRSVTYCVEVETIPTFWAHRD